MEERVCLENLRRDILALWIEAGDSGHGKAQRIAYDRVLLLIDGKPTGINYKVLAETEGK